MSPFLSGAILKFSSLGKEAIQLLFNFVFCTEENLSSRDYVIHMVNEHPDKEPPNDLKKLERGFNCTDCDEIYYSPMFYYRHLKYNHEKIVHVPAVRSKKFMEGV